MEDRIAERAAGVVRGPAAQAHGFHACRAGGQMDRHFFSLCPVVISVDVQ